MRIRQLHQDLALLTREVGAYGGRDAENGSIDAVLLIVGKVRDALNGFECAHRRTHHPFMVGDIVRCWIGTSLEHETRVVAVETNDLGEHFFTLDSSPNVLRRAPSDHVRLIRPVRWESGPIEDAHGPVAGDHPGATFPAFSVTRQEFDELALRLDQLAENVAKLVSAAEVARRDIDALVGRMDETDVRTSQVAAIVDNHCALPGEISAIAGHVEVIDDKVRKLEGEWHPIIAAVGHARQKMMENGT